MSSCPPRLSPLALTPYFDLELFMNLAQERRLGGEVMERVERLWEAWLPELTAQTLSVGQGKAARDYLLVSLGPAVDAAVDAAWAQSPAEGFRLNALAQTLCMAAVHEVLPQVADAGCAPAPKPCRTLRDALDAAGVPYKGEGPALTRRFAILTAQPFRGGCETCCLVRECPRALGREDKVSSVLLPGHE